MQININKDLLPMKAHYFLFNGGVAPVQPFMPVIAKDLKFSSEAVGIINGVLPFTGILAKPLFGVLADHFRLHKFVFITFQIITIIGFFSINFLPKIDIDSGQVKLVCGAETNFDVCFEGTNKNCLIEDVLRESFFNKTVKCSLRCDLSSALRLELCGQWNVNPSICTEDISLKTSVPEYVHVTEEDRVTNLTDPYEPIEGVKLEFIATVPLYHLLKVKNCLYFRITDAQLNDETHHIPYCLNESHTYCNIHCDDPTLTELFKHQGQKNTNNDFVHYSQFWLYLFFGILSWVGMAVVGSVADAVCFGKLGANGNDYGKQRLWGSVGWGVFAIVSGLLVDKFSSDQKTNYAPAFYIMFFIISCDVVCSCLLKYEQTKVSSNIFKNVGKLLKDMWIIVFVIWCIIVGMCVGVQWTFLFWHLENLSASCENISQKKTILGLVSGVQCFLGELPSYFVFGWIIKKLGHIHLMTIIPFIIGIRFILYSILPNPWWALPVEILQCSVGFTFATMASYGSIVAPPGAEATVQGLVGATFEGIGVSLGSYLGGIIFQENRGELLFQVFGTVAFGLGILHGAVQYLLGKNKKITQENGFNGVAKYAIPNEAVSMLEDTQ